MIRGLVIATLLAAPAFAEGEYSEGSEAKAWNVAGEEKARFNGTVVDVLCDLTGDCPADCGAGTRQLAIRRSADDKLILVSKNAQAAFTGAARELAPFCAQEVEVDGNLVGDPELTQTKFYQVQKIRAVGADEWVSANRWTKVWNEQNPDQAKVKGAWYRKDPLINAQIEAEGYLGLGLEADETFIADWF